MCLLCADAGVSVGVVCYQTVLWRRSTVTTFRRFQTTRQLIRSFAANICRSTFYFSSFRTLSFRLTAAFFTAFTASWADSPQTAGHCRSRRLASGGNGSSCGRAVVAVVVAAVVIETKRIIGWKGRVQSVDDLS